jgi:phosphoribosylglycinamide formyltransferase-1
MKIGILISGRGSNMAAIIDAVHSGEIPGAEVAVVISDKADAAGLERARERGVETLVIERKRIDAPNGALKTREEHDTEIVAELQKRGVELVCLAGYMRLLSPVFVNAFPNRIVNIHPSLLPAYPGLNVHERVLAAGENTSGCTVHFVDELLDHGDVILQRSVPVLATDTPETLAARILEIEHETYVAAIKKIVGDL